VVAQIRAHGELLDETKPDIVGEDRERYYAGTEFDKAIKPVKSAMKNKDVDGLDRVAVTCSAAKRNSSTDSS
jgi:hypothetical protein